MATGKRYLAISVERGVGPVVVDLENCCLLHRFAYHSHALAFSPDETLLCFNTGHLVLLYSLPLMERKSVRVVGRGGKGGKGGWMWGWGGGAVGGGW